MTADTPAAGTRVRNKARGEGVVTESSDGYAYVQWDKGKPRESRIAAMALDWDGKAPDSARYEPPRASDLTDTGNGHRLVRRHGQNIHYVAEDKAWCVWDGSRWKNDTLGAVMELAKETAVSIYAEAAAVTGDDDAADILRKRIAGWATSSLSYSRLTNMVKAAQTDPAVAISAEQLDTDIWLLNCTNGTLDLRTGELRPGAREDLITKTTGIEYDPEATCPRWDLFIEWAMDGRLELVEFLTRVLGMSLSGNVWERKVFFLHGGGDNGKSVTLKTVLHVAGEYGMRIPATTFEAATFAKGGGGASEHIAVLKGQRFVYTSEMEDGTKLASALLKDATGDEKLRARHLYKGSFEFMPEFTPFIAANHKPIVPSDDQAVWNRMRLVPFDAVIAERDKDGGLGDKLKAEAPGILAKLVQGCLDWQRHGLTEPPEVMEATASYRDEMDTFGDFLDSLEDDGMPDDFRPSALRERYNRWARDNTPDGDRMSARVFKAHMLSRGWTLHQVSSGPDKGARRWYPPVQRVSRVDYAALARAAVQYELTKDEAEWQTTMQELGVAE